MNKYKPTKAEVLASGDKIVPDLIKPNLKVLFCGINPGLYTAAIGFHFGRPGNRFWPSLYASGFTPRLFDPSEQEQLLSLGYGITNIVPRASATAAEVSKQELLDGRKQLETKVLKYKPEWLAILGVEAYRKSFERSKAKVGRQEDTIGTTKLWILPNPSGLNAHYTPNGIAEVLKEFYRVIYS